MAISNSNPSATRAAMQSPAVRGAVLVAMAWALVRSSPPPEFRRGAPLGPDNYGISGQCSRC